MELESRSLATLEINDTGTAFGDLYGQKRRWRKVASPMRPHRDHTAAARIDLSRPGHPGCGPSPLPW
jgi:hypothetical protein